jgi:RHS repeat-associated protein
LVYTKNEDDGSSTSNTIKFIYDVMNTPYGFILNDKDKNMKVYLFIKNLQGDIVGIVNESGKTVLTYEYNSWGHPSEPNAMDDETIEQLKLVLPMTYRGYCYDYDSGLYFIQNRYYNPEIGRFINVDNINSLITAKIVLDFNLFAYCGNNPITYSLKYKDKSEYLTIESNYAYNKSKSNIINSYIYRQNDSIGKIDGTDGIVSPLHFGNTKFGPNGCGIVATYNALIMLGNRTDIADINRECEINGVSVCGSISFYPAYLVRYFKSKGYTVYVTYDKNKFDNNNTIKNAKANIIYYTKPKNGHYVAFNYDGSNYWGYNVFAGSDVSARCIGGSINAFLDGNGYIGRIIISIY